MLKTVEQRNEEIREKLKEENERVYGTGVECPDCKTELRYIMPCLVLMSYPAQQEVRCPNCGLKTRILAG